MSTRIYANTWKKSAASRYSIKYSSYLAVGTSKFTEKPDLLVFRCTSTFSLKILGPKIKEKVSQPFPILFECRIPNSKLIIRTANF